MDLLYNIGISYKGSYISQGSLIDKCKKSTSLELKNIEFTVKNDGKEANFDNIRNYYDGNIMVHLPTININQTNLKTIKEYVNNITKNNITTITMEASTLLYDAFEWSTVDEQQNYLRNIARGLTNLIVNNKIKIAIENTYKDKENDLFGKTICNISDLLVHSRKILMEEYEFTKKEASDLIGISLNIDNIIKNNDIGNIGDWFKVFYNDIKCIKIKNNKENLKYLDYVLNCIINLNMNIPILLEIDSDIEYIYDEFVYFKNLVIKKLQGEVVEFNETEYNENKKSIENNYRINHSESGYTNLAIIIIIIFTIISAILMIVAELG